MKTHIITLTIVLVIGLTGNAGSQTINWESLKPETRHVVSLHAGWDYGLSYGVGYGYQLRTLIPVVVTVSGSLPTGSHALDDFKSKLGVEAQVYRLHNFRFNVSVSGLYRRYENRLVRLQNFGSEMAGLIGYYKPGWFVAGEFGFDKAIVTHFKHSEDYREFVWSGVQDGWYEPATGGNFNYGIRAGVTVKQHDITLKAGRLHTQDFRSQPQVPYYFQVGFNHKFGRSSEVRN